MLTGPELPLQAPPPTNPACQGTLSCSPGPHLRIWTSLAVPPPAPPKYRVCTMAHHGGPARNFLEPQVEFQRCQDRGPRIQSSLEANINCRKMGGGMETPHTSRK